MITKKRNLVNRFSINYKDSSYDDKNTFKADNFDLQDEKINPKIR